MPHAMDDVDRTYIRCAIDEKSSYRFHEPPTLNIFRGHTTISSRTKRLLSTLCKILHIYHRKAQ